MADYFNDTTQAILVEALAESYVDCLVKDRPFLDGLTKKGGKGGTSERVAMNQGFGGGAGTTLAASLANATVGGAENIAFTITPQILYGTSVLANKQVAYTQHDESAVDTLLQATFASAELAADAFDKGCFSDGHGTWGTISSNTNPTGTIYNLILTVPSDAAKFDKGMVLVSKSSPTASIDSGSATVLGNSPQSGLVRVDAGSSGWTPTNAHVVGQSTIMVTGSDVSGFPGMLGFVPPVTARDSNFVVGDTFLGMTRDAAVSVPASSGWAFDARGKALVPSIEALAGQMAIYGKQAHPDTLYVNPIVLGKIATALDTKIRYDMPAKTEGATAMFMGVDILTPAGKVTALSAGNCPASQMILTKASAWHLDYPTKSPFGPATLDGKIMVSAYDTDDTRFTTKVTGFFYPEAVISTGVLTIA